MADNSVTDAPLPSLRTPAPKDATTVLQASSSAANPVITSVIDEEMPPLPTLRIPRSSAPISFEPEDEHDFMPMDQDESPYGISGEEMRLLDEAERTGGIQNPVYSQASQNNSPFIPASTDRPMVRQSPRTFESRTGTTIDTGSKPAGPTAPLSSASSMVMFDDIAPSELEIFTRANLIPVVKGEKAISRDGRHNENELRVATHIVAIMRRIEELERKQVAQQGELLKRIEAIITAAPATSNSTLTASFSKDLSRLKEMNTQGRTAIVNLTQAVNELVDLPRDVSQIAHAVRELAARPTRLESSNIIPSVRTPASSAQGSSESHLNSFDSHVSTDRETSKRDRPFPVAEPEAKRAKLPYVDVYLWPVIITKINTPTKIAYMAMERLHLNTHDVFMSVRHPMNTPNSVISIRFREAEDAKTFIETLRASAPADMKKLHAAYPSVYEKRKEPENNQREASNPW
ncbi:hypothetical protein C8R43DRAFT_699379 [Mycena crocata]|nr:hypothetical protein C8R43DRAFT_699379 [Mycena crocata]